MCVGVGWFVWIYTVMITWHRAYMALFTSHSCHYKRVSTWWRTRYLWGRATEISRQTCSQTHLHIKEIQGHKTARGLKVLLQNIPQTPPTPEFVLLSLPKLQSNWTPGPNFQAFRLWQTEHFRKLTSTNIFEQASRTRTHCLSKHEWGLINKLCLFFTISQYLEHQLIWDII